MSKKMKPTDKPQAATGSKSPNILETRKSDVWRGVTYQLQKRGQRQYWYAFFHDAASGKTRSKYVGKTFRELNDSDFEIVEIKNYAD